MISGTGPPGLLARSGQDPRRGPPDAAVSWPASKQGPARWPDWTGISPDGSGKGWPAALARAVPGDRAELLLKTPPAPGIRAARRGAAYVPQPGFAAPAARCGRPCRLPLPGSSCSGLMASASFPVPSSYSPYLAATCSGVIGSRAIEGGTPLLVTWRSQAAAWPAENNAKQLIWDIGKTASLGARHGGAI